MKLCDKDTDPDCRECEHNDDCEGGMAICPGCEAWELKELICPDCGLCDEDCCTCHQAEMRGER